MDVVYVRSTITSDGNAFIRSHSVEIDENNKDSVDKNKNQSNDDELKLENNHEQ